MRRAAALLVLAPALLAAARPPLLLEPNALVVRSPGQPPRRIAFGSPRARAIAAVAARYGKPLRTRTVPDCGQGIAIGEAKFRGGIELSFIAGRFAGYSIDRAGPATAKGVVVGSDRRALDRAYPGVALDGDASDGWRWTGPGEDGLTGFISSDRPDGRVTAIVGGETCVVA